MVMTGPTSRWCQAWLALLLLVSSGCATSSTSSAIAGDGRTDVTLREGQVAPVAGTDLTIRVEQVTDLTSQGCLGGPVGCKDQVRLEISRGTERKTVVLYVAHTQLQRQEGVNQAQVLGYTITLAALRGKDVTLNIRRPS